MGIEKKYSWAKERGLKGVVESGGQNCIVEAVEGVGSSVVVSMYAVDDMPISITMNGEEVLADVVLFSLSSEEVRGDELVV